MTPHIAEQGWSFRGAFLYYMHDKQATTSERVSWTHTMNMMTDCVKKAWKVMAYTVEHRNELKQAAGKRLSGRKLEKPVFAYSLSWSPEQKPDKEEMLKAARQSLKRLGLEDYEVAIAAHNDTPHKHIHVIVNRVHPVTGIAKTIHEPKIKLSDWAYEYELATGKVYCKMREENYHKRRQGERTKYNDPHIVKAWERSHNALTFDRMLANKGYQLAQGRKRLVVVDPYDKAHNPTRHLKGIAKAKEFHERMEGLDHGKLPTVEAVIARRNIERQLHAEHIKQHEDRTAEALGREFSRHYAEKEKLMQRHARRIDLKLTKLEDHYKLHKKQARIDDLKQQLEHPDFFQKLSFKIFKTDRKLARDVIMLEKSRDNAKQRIKEAIKPLEKQREQELQAMNKRHASELERLNDHLAGWKPRPKSLASEWSQATHERGISRDRDHGYEEPGLSR